VKPVLKWAGGKSRLAPMISRAFLGPCRGLYLEPFLGSASVYLYRRAHGEINRALLADVNPKLVAMHVALRDEPEAVIEALAAMPSLGWEGHYYAIREQFNTGPHVGAEHAARFIWLNRAGFNGLYRENRAGGFNVPIGRYAELKVPEPDHLRRVSEMLKPAEIVAAPFDEVIQRAGPGDHVYCDPPYVPLNATAAFTSYAKDPFGLVEQKSLALASQRAAFRGATVVLSNHDLPLVRNELYKESEGFRHVARPPVGRSISGSIHTRNAIHEVIAAIGPMRQVA
jgi:DNA adenine methylase